MGAKPYVSSAVVTKDHLTELEETLIVFIRTYLQRVTSNLSAQEFVEMVQAAVVLVDSELSAKPLSLSERKILLCNALQTFGTQLSQPIPPLGTQIPKSIAELIARLVRYQKLTKADGVEAALNTLMSQLLKTSTHSLNPLSIRTALENGNLINLSTLESQNSLNDLANILFFRVQFQTEESSRTAKTKSEIQNQVEQAIADFKATYQSLSDFTQPVWDDELSVSSSWFNAKDVEIC